MNNRIDQLDSIRGLAALFVLTSHITLIISQYPIFIGKLLSLPPFILFTNGTTSVMCFFVLSGFVLSIPFYKSDSLNYYGYLVKRFFRIYVPYLVAIVFCVIMVTLISPANIEELSYWFNKSWTKPINMKIILEHLLLIGNIHTETFNGVIWSLNQELRISIIFPFLVLLLKKLNLKMNILMCILLTVLGVAGKILDLQPIPIDSYGISVFDTIRFIPLFIMGSLIAKHKERIMSFYYNLGNLTKFISLFCCFGAYSYGAVFIPRIDSMIGFSKINFAIVDLASAFGSMGFIIFAIGSILLAKVLMLKPISYLGKISYSLYLYHLPIIVGLVHLLHERLSIWLIFLIAILVSFLVSSIAYYVIEKPSMQWGRKLADKLKDRRMKTPTINKNGNEIQEQPI